jgi:ABC-type transport system involved in multi-copper enzyme maturation permease subunit
MTDTLPTFLVFGPVLCLIQLAAALPWVAAVDPEFIKGRFRGLQAWGINLAVVLGAGVVLAVVMEANKEPRNIATIGRLWTFLLQAQLSADLVVGILWGLLKASPKTGAVALAAFREGVRQPLFWILLLAGVLVLLILPFLPYFTFGEDLKMLKDLGYSTIMFSAAVFGVLAASMSIAEEIEGRTAVTVMSKPISRRNFLLGKFGGLLLACLIMTMLLALLMVWVIIFFNYWSPPVVQNPFADPAWVTDTLTALAVAGPGGDLLRGALLWVYEMGTALPGFVITFGQVMVLLAIAVALATRLPMIVNAMAVLAVYFLGHLTPVLTAISQNVRLVSFIAQLFNYALPGLDLFDMGPAVVRYAPLPPGQFALYTLNVSLYALVYTAISLLLGLILFEDRDLA